MQDGSKNASTINMNLIKKYIFIAACIPGCFFYGCENNVTEVRKLNTKSLGVEEGRNIVLNYTIGGKIKTILKAPLMLRIQDTTNFVEFPQTLTADFYNDQGIVESRLTARYGKYAEMKATVVLRDSVKVINFLKGDTLYTDELYWDRMRTGTEFYTEKKVRIRTKTQVIDGVGMEASQDFRNHHIKKITGTIAVPASKFPG